MRLFTAFLILLITAALLNYSCRQNVNQVTSPLDWAKKMADSDMKRNPDASMLDFSPKPNWSYTQGLVCLANQWLAAETGDQRYYQYGLDYANKMISDSGTIATYKMEKYNVDLINSGKILFDIYQKSGNEKYKKAILLLREQLKTHPRTSEGGFWHKQVYQHQMWLDGIYMADPFYARFGQVFNEPEAFDDVVNQVVVIQKHTVDSVTGLNYHGWDESREQQWADSITGRSPHVWGRAQGWYLMALVDILDFLPQDHPGRDEIIRILNTAAKAVVHVQDTISGVWYQVLDQSGREGNYLESTASCMFVYSLLKGIRMGYLDQSFMDPAKNGFEGILKNFIKENEDGAISLTGCCAVAGLGGKPYRDGSYAYYIGAEVRDNDPKGVGPFIMACIEMHKAVKADHTFGSCSRASEEFTLEDAWQLIKTKRFVDLTHTFSPGIPHWKGFPDAKEEVLYWYEPGVGTAGSGFYAQSFTHVGQWGTHVDPPAHFAKGLRTVDQISVKEMILPLVVIDVHEKVADNADYTISMDDVKDWERRYGPVPEGSFVAMRTDWSRRWPGMEAMQNKDANGIAHYPGWSLEVLKYLYEDRKITASGHETTDTDSGIATSKDDYSLETYVLKQNHYQVELLTNLSEVPQTGALVIVAFPKPKDGSGFPARVFAIIP